MKLTKNEAKKLALQAKKIIQGESYTAYDGSTTPTEKTVTFEEMTNELKGCSRWWADQYEDKVFVNGTTCTFTVEL